MLSTVKDEKGVALEISDETLQLAGHNGMTGGRRSAFPIPQQKMPQRDAAIATPSAGAYLDSQVCAAPAGVIAIALCACGRLGVGG